MEGNGGALAVEPRVAFLNDSNANQQLISTKQYARNIMVTSKYTVVSFVPKTIFEFFRVVANVYFLLISLLQLATPWSPTNRFTTAGPLLFVLLVTMIKQGSEDFKRHQADDKQNRRSCRIINAGGQTELIAWQDLQVGQLVCVENREELPADVVIIATSEEEGRCFIETSNLDGETNLKRRVAVKPTAQLVGWRELQGDPIPQETICAAAVRRLRGSVEHEQPNNQLYTFTGRLILRDSDRGETAVPLGPENLLLRGCSLRSCAFIVGLVIFTGSETKLLQNSRAAPSKQSKLYRTANRCMLLIFSTMFGLCLASAIAASHWSKKNANRVWYLPFIKEADQADDFIVNFFTFLILYNNLVPISLYVSLDIIKVLQANRITGDSKMSYEGNHAIARTSELNEELGQVEYVFSDKTGTLTCNVMEFRKCSIGGISYGFGTTEIGRAVAALASGKPKKSPTKAKVNPLLGHDQSCLRLDVGSTDDVREAELAQQLQGEEGFNPKDAQVHFDPQIHFDDPGLLRALYAGGKQGELIHEFLTLLSICHTVIPETDVKTGTVAYRASSPDEEALVKAAKCLGYNFLAPAPLMKVEISYKSSLLPAKSSGKEPRTKSYTIVNVNEFNSTRKRMSVVAVNDETNEYVLYCKGADNMMLERAAAGKDESETAVHAKLVGHLQNYAREGLRTLVLGRRVLTEEEYNEYNDAYIAASTALDDREEKLDTCAEMVEKNMQLLGVTAIEDKLQDGVPCAISDLAQAGIKVWVLTGDREETAVNIGHACRLINDQMQLLYVNAERIDALSGQLDALYETPEIQRLIRGGQVAENLAMVCDGKALVHIFPSRDTRVKLSIQAVERIEKLSAKLLDIARVCKALIACRVSPSQKAEIVQLVRKGECKREQAITLAIGDGANDVSMIQTAHVGVGICGKEGVQAVNASDYAIAQFRFLTRLVLLHGRCNYKRVCKVIRYSFYKNIALVISLFVFNFYNGQSGAPLFESFVMAGWNFFLALPIIVIGVFDQDISEEVVLKFPQLYRRGQHDSDLNMRVFTKTIVNSVAHALICFFGCYAGNRYTNYGLYVVGTLFYTTLLGTMKLKVALLALSWNKYHLAVLAFSVGLFIFFLLVYPHFTFMSYDMFGVPAYMITLQRYWTLLLLCPIAALTIDFTATAAQQQFRPTAEDILRERFRPGKSKRVSDIVAPMTMDHGSPSVDKLLVAEESIDEDKSSSKGQKPNAFVVTAQPPSPNRRTNSTNNLPVYDSFRGTLPQPQARSSFAFNGLDDVAGRHASGELPAPEAVTMRVLSFQKNRGPSRSSSLGRLPVESDLVLKSVSFLFNVGDGTQRLCMEHHVRLAKLQQVFLTELRSHIVGGLPGMVLTVSDIGRKPGIHVNGPPGTKKYLKATRHFLYRPDFKLEATEVPIVEEKKEKNCYEDDEVVVHAIAVEKVKVGAKRKLNESPSSEGEEQSSHVGVSYVVETRPQRGKFLVDKAKALGVPKGKLFGQLHQGKDVTLPDGRVVKSSDCVLPSVPAAGCVIVSCPTAAHVDSLVSSDGFKRYREADGKAEVQVEVVFHLGGVEVLRHSKYQEWARSFGAQARHVLLGHGACAQKTVYRASAKLQAQLHAVFPHAFPSNEAHELKDTIEPFSRVVPDVSSLKLSASSEEKVVLGESMLSFILAPQARRGFDSSRCWPRLDFDQIRESVDIVAKIPDSSSTKRSDEDLLDGRITFLGTGCAIPSKYRNVTGMYVELPIGDDWAGLMLDCGEGSLGQLYRYANGDSKRLQELVNRLKCVWISHNHADHHLGLLRLLSHRPDDSNTEPLLVIGPTPLRFWLDEYSEQDPTVRGKYTFVENYSFDEGDSRYNEVDTHAEAARVRVWLKETLNITQLECVPVKHALQSYAAVVTFVDGSKLAFSGDCRPSDKLAEKANGAFLIVHEATFEDELTKEAKDKAHCTMAEAIEVGRQANARHLLLTHFSQRYPKMAVVSTEGTEDTMEVLTAIDMLSLRFRELRQPNLMNVITQLMAIDDEEDIDAAQSLKAQQEREERKKQKSIERVKDSKNLREQ